MIVKSVELGCTPERAFALFTECAGQWWPPERRHTNDAASEIRLETNGRFFERASDGREVELGLVRAFEPGSRLMLDWYPGTGPDNPTQVEVTFKPIATGTRITIVHGPGRAGDDVYGRSALAYGQSWDLILAAMLANAPGAA